MKNLIMLLYLQLLFLDDKSSRLFEVMKYVWHVLNGLLKHTKEHLFQMRYHHTLILMDHLNSSSMWCTMWQHVIVFDAIKYYRIKYRETAIHTDDTDECKDATTTWCFYISKIIELDIMLGSIPMYAYFVPMSVLCSQS